MDDILTKITANKRREVALQKEKEPLSELLKKHKKELERETFSFRKSLQNSETGIIAEFKRKSPSKGWLFPGAKIESILPLYEKNRASVCSVLTDKDFFGGDLSDLENARKLVNLPLLRKDFIIDEYQLVQAKTFGADAVLLIGAILTKEEFDFLSEVAHYLGLEVLLEIHNEEELSFVNENTDILGVNNRNLGTFHTEVAHSFVLMEEMKKIKNQFSLPPLMISESGISDVETVKELRKVGFEGFLIGETFMKTENPGETLKTFIQNIKK